MYTSNNLVKERTYFSNHLIISWQGDAKAIGDEDLLRLALQKIESLQSQISTLNSQPATGTPSPTPSTTPRSSPAEPSKESGKKTTVNTGTPDDDEPIRTPDGVAVLLMHLYMYKFTYMNPSVDDRCSFLAPMR